MSNSTYIFLSITVLTFLLPVGTSTSQRTVYCLTYRGHHSYTNTFLRCHRGGAVPCFGRIARHDRRPVSVIYMQAWLSSSFLSFILFILTSMIMELFCFLFGLLARLCVCCFFFFGVEMTFTFIFHIMYDFFAWHAAASSSTRPLCSKLGGIGSWICLMLSPRNASVSRCV